MISNKGSKPRTAHADQPFRVCPIDNISNELSMNATSSMSAPHVPIATSEPILPSRRSVRRLMLPSDLPQPENAAETCRKQKEVVAFGKKKKIQRPSCIVDTTVSGF